MAPDEPGLRRDDRLPGVFERAVQRARRNSYDEGRMRARVDQPHRPGVEEEDQAAAPKAPPGHHLDSRGMTSRVPASGHARQLTHAAAPARVICLAGLLASAWAATAAEIDSVTSREIRLSDSTATIERRLNEALRVGVERANARGEVCDESVLYAELRHVFASPFIGHVIAESLNADEDLDSRRVLRVDSIYRDLGLLDAVSVHWKDLSAVVRVGDTLMGVDKIGHFVVEGWEYFETADLEGEGIDAAMTWGEGAEDTYFGRYTTGVRSYADLVANVEGMRFWQNVVGRFDRPIPGGRGLRRPLVRCGRRFGLFGERRWRVTHAIDLRDYVTPAWDEGVNCCSYRNAEIEALVVARITELSDAAGRDLSCPVDPSACVKARERYGDLAPRLLHPLCLGASPGPNPWWKFWRFGR